MTLEFRRQVTFHGGAEQDPADAHQESAKPPHDGFSDVRNRARMAVVLSHSRAALATCFRPARVRL